MCVYVCVWERGGERDRRNESFVFAHISRNILCLSLLPLVYPVSVCPARPCVSVLLFSFLLFPPARSLRAPAVAVAVVVFVVDRLRPSLLRGEVHAFVVPCISVAPNTTSYIFQAMFTFEIKRGTNSGRRALMVTVQSVIAALKCG